MWSKNEIRKEEKTNSKITFAKNQSWLFFCLVDPLNSKDIKKAKCVLHTTLKISLQRNLSHTAIGTF